MAHANSWVAVDLDGTLARYDGWRGIHHIGEPIPLMCDRVRRWLADGVKVKIFTARVSPSSCAANRVHVEDVKLAIEVWCRKHFGQTLPITHEKDLSMLCLWDDRCVSVEANTGKILTKDSPWTQ